MEEIVIYTITSLYLTDPNVESHKVRLTDLEYRSRMVAVYKTLDKAKRCVEEDWPDFDEAGYYNFIVIEGLNEGCYPGLGDHEWWYKYDDTARGWVPCEKPKSLMGIVNFYG